MDLEHWRKQIDELNRKIVELLSERARCAIEVGKIKRESGQPMYAPERETAVLNQLKALNNGPLSDEAVQRIFRQIIDEALRLEQEHAEEES
jgi:chorismate mutase-like protein